MRSVQHNVEPNLLQRSLADAPSHRPVADCNPNDPELDTLIEIYVAQADQVDLTLVSSARLFGKHLFRVFVEHALAERARSRVGSARVVFLSRRPGFRSRARRTRRCSHAARSTTTSSDGGDGEGSSSDHSYAVSSRLSLPLNSRSNSRA